MSEEKWNVERVHKEIQEARTKLFVVAKVLETGNIQFAEHSEWVLVIKPILEDLLGNAQKISQMIEPEKKE